MNGCRRDPERTEIRALQRHVSFKGADILEIGCGDGRLTRRIARLARAVVATDPNAALIARAKRLTPASLREKVRYRVAAAENLRSPDERFDVAVLSWSL
jgi:ubiquinone/menaquinone biosynthesis C-methylase UbiE